MKALKLPKGMYLSRYISKNSIIDIKSTGLKGALEELLSCYPPEEKQKMLDALLAQENTVSSYLGQGIALPHLKIPMRKKYTLIFGRIRVPFSETSFNGNEKSIRLIVLFLASDKIENYLSILSSLAKVVQANLSIDELEGLSLEEFRQKVLNSFRAARIRTIKINDRFNKLVLRESLKIAKAGNCSTLFLFTDTFANPNYIVKEFHPKIKTVIVTHNALEPIQNENFHFLPIQFFGNGRLTQLRSALLLGLIHKCITYNEKICCIGGLPNNNRLDTVLIVEVHREIQSVFFNQKDILPKNVRPEVFERLLSIATELAVEGREGKPVGCLFILGDIQELTPYVYPLVLNPFYGYKEEDRNLLNPFIEETIKEYSLLDGAFVINGNGILESAGSLIHTKEQISLPSGYGTRHSAALAISNTVDCIALTVSASNGQVTLFRKGKMLPLIEKGIGHTASSLL